MSLNLESNRTKRINGAIFLEGVRWLFVQGLTTVWDASIFTRDFTGTGQSVFTQSGDVIGSFAFNTKNTVDAYKIGSALDIDNVELIGTMIKAIASQKPVKVTFIQTFVAVAEAGGVNDRIRVTFDGRIMKPELSWLVDEAVDGVVIDGEILQSPSPTVVRDTNP